MIRKYFFLAVLISLCTGCGSAVPFATTYPWDTQRKMQAARHWEILADDMADQVHHYIKKRKDLRDLPVYVVSKDSCAFEEIFHELLVGKLLDRGLVVTQSSLNALQLEYSTAVLEHGEQYYQKIPMKFTALGTGIIVARNLENVDRWMDRTRTRDLLGIGATAGVLADVAMSHYAGDPSQNEVIFTTRLTYNDSLFLQKSDIYYINDPDVNHYMGQDEIQREGRSFNVVN